MKVETLGLICGMAGPPESLNFPRRSRKEPARKRRRIQRVIALAWAGDMFALGLLGGWLVAFPVSSVVEPSNPAGFQLAAGTFRVRVILATVVCAWTIFRNRSLDLVAASLPLPGDRALARRPAPDRHGRRPYLRRCPARSPGLPRRQAARPMLSRWTVLTWRNSATLSGSKEERIPWSRNLAAEESLGRGNWAGRSPLVAENNLPGIPWSAARETLGLREDEPPKGVMRGRKKAKDGEIQLMLDNIAGGDLARTRWSGAS